MPLKNMKNRCTARSKKTGERCQNPAVTGYSVCYHHGAKQKNRGGRRKGCAKPEGSGGRPVGNKNALKHGAYSPRLPPEELPTYEKILARYMKDVHEPSETDKMTLERLAIYETKLRVAVEQGGQPDALDVLDRLLNRNLKALQVTRESKDTARSTGTTPAEVVAALLTRARDRNLLPTPQPVEAEFIDVEVVDVEADERPEED